MERERKQNGIILGLLIVTVLSLSVAFAATLSSTLNIAGTASYGSAKWDVHFESASTKKTSDIQATNGPSIEGNTINYSVTLQENKSYIMDIVVKNAGTYEAKLSELTLTGAEDYDFITYKAEGMAVNDTIAAGQTKTITVTVSMAEINNTNISSLENGLNLNLTATAKFADAN